MSLQIVDVWWRRTALRMSASLVLGGGRKCFVPLSALGLPFRTQAQVVESISSGPRVMESYHVRLQSQRRGLPHHPLENGAGEKCADAPYQNNRHTQSFDYDPDRITTFYRGPRY